MVNRCRSCSRHRPPTSLFNPAVLPPDRRSAPYATAARQTLNNDVASWYAGGTPTETVMLADLESPAAYNRRVDYCRQVQEQYGADLLPGSDSGPNWAGTLEALRSVDRLVQVLPKVPAPLQEALSAEGGLNRPALAQAAKTLAEQAAALRQYVDVLAQDYDIGEIAEAPGGQVRIAAEKLTHWIEAQIN